MSETGLQSNVYTTQAGNVYLKQAGTFGRYVWGGRRMRMDEIQEALGDVSTTTRFDPRGGVQRDMLLSDIPGVVSTTLVMKHEQLNRMKAELAAGFWNVDKRMHVQGRDRDAPDKWAEIRRLMWGKATQRTDPGTSWEAEEEGMIQLPWSALDAYDINPVVYAEGSSTVAHQIVDVRAAVMGSANPSDNLLYAVSGNPTVGDPVLLVNANGGAVTSWVERALTGETAVPVAVLGLGDFVFISLGTKIMRSDDRGVTLTDITLTDWATNNLLQMDALDQGFILGCGQNGRIFASFDGARTWEILVGAGGPTTENLLRIHISRNNPQVAWACGENNALIKTENGGFSWFSITGPAAAEDLLGLHVEDPDSLLVLSAEGIVYETSDGGDTWIQQGGLPGVTASAFARGNIVGTPADVYYLFLSDTTNGEFVFRNTEAGADGYWYQVEQATVGEELYGIAAADVNVASIVGGTADTSSLVALVA